MRNKIMFIIIPAVIIGGVGTFSKIAGIASDLKTVAYKPYKFTERDQAELVVIKFIRAIDVSDLRTVELLMEKDSNYGSVSEHIAEFCKIYRRSKSGEYLIFSPREFIYNDSIVAMRCVIKNLINPTKNKEGTIVLVKRENQWLIKTSSSFFDVLIPSNNKKKEKGDTR